MDMSYDYFIEHDMHAVEWELFSMNIKDKNKINKLNRNSRRPLIRKHSHVPFEN